MSTQVSSTTASIGFVAEITQILKQLDALVNGHLARLDPAVHRSPEAVARNDGSSASTAGATDGQNGFYLNTDNAPRSGFSHGVFDAVVTAVTPHMFGPEGAARPVAASIQFAVTAPWGERLGVFTQRASLIIRTGSFFLRIMSAVLGRPLTAAEAQGNVHSQDLLGRHCMVELRRQKIRRGDQLPRLLLLKVHPANYCRWSLSPEGWVCSCDAGTSTLAA